MVKNTLECRNLDFQHTKLLLRNNNLILHKPHLVHKVPQGLGELVPSDDGDIVLGQVLCQKLLNPLLVQRFRPQISLRQVPIRSLRLLRSCTR